MMVFSVNASLNSGGQTASVCGGASGGGGHPHDECGGGDDHQQGPQQRGRQGPQPHLHRPSGQRVPWA